MTAPLVIGMGEFLWDVLPAGAEMGGAPANFACHCAALGLEAAVISGVGEDASGRELCRRLESFGVITEGIAVHADLPTSTVSVELDAAGQPTYVIHEGVAWDRIVAGPEQVALVSRASAICFGTLAQRSGDSRRAMQSLLAAADPEVLRVLDVNLRPPFVDEAMLMESLELADAVKLNEGEVGYLMGLFGAEGDDWRVFFDQLMARFRLRLVVCTRGGEGSILYDGVRWEEHHGCETRAVDTVGAGDSFTAVVVSGLLRGWELGAISALANEVAAFVCSRSGATPELPEELRGRFCEEGPVPEARGSLSPANL